MWQFIAGCVSGIYIGTHYDCKPAFKYVKDCLKKSFPKKD